MTCLKPIVVPSKARDSKQGQTQFVPCGKCVGCLQDRQNEWIYRLECQQRTSKHSLFITLTYDPANVPLQLRDGSYDVIRYSDYIKRKSLDDVEFCLFPKDLQNYFKRVRKSLKSSNLKYFACGEYGDQFNRPHFHAAIFYDTPDDSIFVERALYDCWDKGYVQIEPLIDNRIKYVTKYILKSSLESPPDDLVYPCFQRASHELGLKGMCDDECYFFRIGHDDSYRCLLNSGISIAQPRYYRRKFYPDDLFETDKIQSQNEKRFKREKETFNRFAQDYKIKTGESDLDKIESAYLRYKDSEQQNRNFYLRKKSSL